MRGSGLPATRDALDARWPRGLRAATGGQTRNTAVQALLEVVTTGVVTAHLCAVVGWTALAIAHQPLLELALAMIGIWMLAVQIELFLPTLWCVPYAALGVLLLVKLGINNRASMALLGAAPALLWFEPTALCLVLAISGAVGGVMTQHAILSLALVKRQSRGPQVIVAHDGGSALCRSYVRSLSARFLGELQCIDSRDDGALRSRLLAAQVNPESGLVVLTAHGPLQGPSALRWLSRQTAPGVRWLAVDLLFASPLAYALYPAIRAIRVLQLWRAGLPRLDRIAPADPVSPAA